MEQISFHPPVHIKNFIEFDCRDNRDRVTSQLTITNNKEISVAFKLKTTNQAIFMVKPGQGIINPTSSVTITLVLVYDPAKVAEIEKQRFQLTLLDIYDQVDIGHLNEVIKEREASATTFKFKVQILQNDPHPYLPTAHKDAHQPVADYRPPTEASQRRDSAFGQSQGGSHIYRSMVEQELAQVNEVEKNLMSGAKAVEKQTERGSDEILNLREREIAKLQEEKKKLEAALNEIRIQATTSKVVEKASATVKTFETWQLVGVVIVALFLGYFIASK